MSRLHQHEYPGAIANLDRLNFVSRLDEQVGRAREGKMVADFFKFRRKSS